MSMTLNQDRFDTLRAALLARRDVLLEELALRQGGDSRAQHAHEMLQQDSEDAAIHGSDREVDLALTDQERRELADIGAALKRLTDGEYGDCIECGCEIGFERLRVMPQALRCIGCESAHEARSGRVQRLTM